MSRVLYKDAVRAACKRMALRQSQDAVMRSKLLAASQDPKEWMNPSPERDEVLGLPGGFVERSIEESKR